VSRADRVSGVHFVTDPELARRHGLLATVDAAVRAGVAVVQLRDKGASARDLLATLTAVSDVVRGRCTLLHDDRTDVVLAARLAGVDVDGVHLGQSDLPVDAARRLLGADAVVGLTADAPEHLADLAEMPDGTVDYLGVGVIRPTTTKPDHPAPLGVAGFGALAAATPLPCIAIGGVGADDVPELTRVGGSGLAVVSAICSADDPERAAHDLVRRWAAAVSA
jgi:thiamine-phosphate pyrophosphorylase